MYSDINKGGPSSLVVTGHVETLSEGQRSNKFFPGWFEYLSCREGSSAK